MFLLQGDGERASSAIAVSEVDAQGVQSSGSVGSDAEDTKTARQSASTR